MSQRVVRVNELLKREISHVLHTRFQEEAVSITVLDVATAASLRNARVYYTTIETGGEPRLAERFFAAKGEEIRREVGRAIVLKYLPHLEFVRDDSAERGTRINEILDDLGYHGEAPPPEAEAEAEGPGETPSKEENPEP